jgi:hypothetical protein
MSVLYNQIANMIKISLAVKKHYCVSIHISFYLAMNEWIREHKLKTRTQYKHGP